MTDPLQYRLTEILGTGPLGSVYVAERSGGGGPTERVALKLLDGPRATPAAVGRLEAALPRLVWVKHPVVVRIQGTVRFEERVGIVGDVVEGCDLRRVLRQGQIPAGPAMEIIAAAAGGLAAAMQQSGPDGEPLQLTHGDLRPTNIMLTRFGEVRLTDLGVLPALTGRDLAEAKKIEPDLRVAPESEARPFAHPQDVYALGLTLFELLAGRPFPRGTLDVASHREALARAVAGLLEGGMDPMTAMLTESLLAFDASSRPAARDVERLARDLRRSVPGPSLREWAAEVVPTVVGNTIARRDALLGMQLRGVETRPDPTKGVAARALPRPAPPRTSRTSFVPEEDDMTVSVTAPGRSTPSLHDLVSAREDTNETEFDYDPTEVTDALVAKMKAAEAMSAPQPAPAAPVAAPIAVPVAPSAAVPAAPAVPAGMAAALRAAPPAGEPPSAPRAVTFSSRIVERPADSGPDDGDDDAEQDQSTAAVPTFASPGVSFFSPKRAEGGAVPNLAAPASRAVTVSPPPLRQETAPRPSPTPAAPVARAPAPVAPAPVAPAPVASAPVAPAPVAPAVVRAAAPPMLEEPSLASLDALPMAAITPLPAAGRPALVIRSASPDALVPEAPAASPVAASPVAASPGVAVAAASPVAAAAAPVAPSPASPPALTEPAPLPAESAAAPVRPADGIPPAAPISDLSTDTDAPPADYPTSPRQAFIMWLPAGCAVVAFTAIAILYVYLKMR